MKLKQRNSGLIIINGGPSRLGGPEIEIGMQELAGRPCPILSDTAGGQGIWLRFGTDKLMGKKATVTS